MPNAKKSNFVIHRIGKRERRDWGKGDLFYFDPVAWQTIMELALTDRVMRKGSKHRPESIAKGKATRKRNQRKASEAVAARLKAKRASRPDGALASEIMAAMSTGEWYGPRDLANAIGRDVRAVRYVLIRQLLPKGMVRREKNAAFRGTVDVERKEIEPEWLYAALRVAPGDEKEAGTG